MTRSTLLMTRFAVLAAAATALGACGSDSPASTTTAPSTVAADPFSDRIDVVNRLMASASQAGVAVDSQCVLDVIAALSDADAGAWADAIRAGNSQPAISADGQQIAAGLADCEVPETAGS